MNTFIRFFYEFVSVFFDGLLMVFRGISSGILKMFYFPDYKRIVLDYSGLLRTWEWILVGLVILVLLVVIVVIILLLIFGVRRVFNIGKDRYSQEDLLDEIGDLNDQVEKLIREKDDIMAMKVSQLGLRPDEDGIMDSVDEDLDDEDREINLENVRFAKLHRLDEDHKGFKPKNYNNNFTLRELTENFRNYSASQLKLYYDYDILRPFISGLACGKLVILQGISGTGKTSLAYAWGKFCSKDSCIASVEPSWRDKTELLGYFNEFTKKFNESDVLAELYEAGFNDDVHTVILDEMNIARVEYYFAEMLSIYEMPSRSEWVIEIVSSGWPEDPKRIENGKLKLPENLWYIGTINNDDSTFMVTDKVYDRAMPIDIDVRVDAFKAKEQDSMEINSSYLEGLFKDAEENQKVATANVEKVKAMEDYVIKHFRVAFGNRIMKQLHTFVPVYVSCGGDELQAIDYFVAKKILRKFDQLNITLIRTEIDPFIAYLNKEFGNKVMKECIAYLERLQKSV